MRWQSARSQHLRIAQRQLDRLLQALLDLAESSDVAPGDVRDADQRLAQRRGADLRQRDHEAVALDAQALQRNAKSCPVNLQVDSAAAPQAAASTASDPY